MNACIFNSIGVYGGRFYCRHRKRRYFLFQSRIFKQYITANAKYKTEQATVAIPVSIALGLPVQRRYAAAYFFLWSVCSPAHSRIIICSGMPTARSSHTYDRCDAK